MAARTAIAYIDGFNFYHGAVRDAPALKWLDFEALCDQLLRGIHVTQVNYYTAVVRDFPTDPTQSQRQNDYLRALRSRTRTEVVLGQFQKKKATVMAKTNQQVRLVDGSSGELDAGQLIRGRTYEEKGSDVNLGTDLSWDACSGQMHVALVVSNDLDLQRPVARAMLAGIEVVVVNPHHRTNGPSLVGTSTRKLSRGDLRRCQLPDHVTLADGVTTVRRPATWA